MMEGRTMLVMLAPGKPSAKKKEKAETGSEPAGRSQAAASGCLSTLEDTSCARLDRRERLAPVAGPTAIIQCTHLF